MVEQEFILPRTTILPKKKRQSYVLFTFNVFYIQFQKYAQSGADKSMIWRIINSCSESNSGIAKTLAAAWKNTAMLESYLQFTFILECLQNQTSAINIIFMNSCNNNYLCIVTCECECELQKM
ncbi:Hypothetical_protein [Hexamita inflata]|uniref:Hypothetical_protein n=1 Tax=Hexamita inflata TaxID=28002 RepID=A0AA86TX15_9EUKA|nr:Hypothetical protein HINF_LOCUS19694 [Hexamita inflata]